MECPSPECAELINAMHYVNLYHHLQLRPLYFSATEVLAGFMRKTQHSELHKHKDEVCPKDIDSINEQEANFKTTCDWAHNTRSGWDSIAVDNAVLL